MPTEFDTWIGARTAAQILANQTGLSVGVEKPGLIGGWSIHLLPSPENRRGWEMRCEVVDPILQKPRP